jgi:peptidoglycan/LPS O-acetylase OafA/YrhL
MPYLINYHRGDAMESEPEDAQSTSKTESPSKSRPFHYIAAIALLAIGYAVGWFLATLRMYSNWNRGVAPDSNVYYAIVGVFFVLLGGVGLIKSSSRTKRVIATGVLGLGVGAVVQYFQLGTAYIDFMWGR